VTLRDARVAVVIDYASRRRRRRRRRRLTNTSSSRRWKKLSLTANPVIQKTEQPQQARPLFNPVFWLLNRGQDIPSWFSLDSERIASLTVVRPEYETRLTAASVLAPQFRGADGAAPDALAAFASSFAGGTDGMSLQALVDISQLARTQGMGLHEIDDAVRCFKVGATENPCARNTSKTKSGRPASRFRRGSKGSGKQR